MVSNTRNIQYNGYTALESQSCPEGTAVQAQGPELQPQNQSTVEHAGTCLHPSTEDTWAGGALELTGQPI